MWDHFSANKSDLHIYQVAKKLLLSCKGARMKYDSYLDKEKKIKSKQKSQGNDYVSEKGKEWLTWLHWFSWHWYNKIYSFEAEKKKDFTLLTKANAFRKSKTGKEKNQLQLLMLH